ncbi:hypothetical protein CC86DRAFT_414628 [Ophiobolus disseminans]|uniref:Amidohydrolase n=1 Tax=Ophiobolus disseminans TaxID=1469910 RepID=A0A6A7AHZ5_9PLEO|nr:hypothetical protein CC86DRAFT_414628 [Ophiobolus disseminans]
MTVPHNQIHSVIEEFRPDLRHYEEMYRDLHQHSELGKQEKRTSKIATSHLREVGYDVTTSIGGHGLADMDALPVKEMTGLSYASTSESVDTNEEKKPVMHACGHDAHVACAMDASTLLAKAKARWKGTLIVLFQPDEEHGAGARAMLDDGLYTKIPKPDLVLGQHLTPVKAGVVLIRPGVFMASAGSFRVTIFGCGAHGALPQDAIDPIVLAASIILMLNIRTFDAGVRDKVLAAVKRIIRGEAIASGVIKEPDVSLIVSYSSTVNDPTTSAKLKESFESYLSNNRTWQSPRITASEDFSLLASDIGVPSVFWNWGGVDPKIWEKYEKTNNSKLIAKTHQENYAPVLDPTIKTGIHAMSLAAFSFLQIVED